MGLSARTTRHARRDSLGPSSPHPAPKPAEHCYQYDAWNRLRRVFTDADSDDTFDAGETVHQESRYDGLNRRITRIAGSGSSWLRTDFYYNASWQIIEEKVSAEQTTFAAAAAASTTARYQYVWDLRYIDSPVLRDEDLDSDGDCTDDEGTGSERLCYVGDANFNVTALIETDGTVTERTIYDAYGQPTLYDSTWSTTITESASKANELRFCGYIYDPIVALYHVRYRVYHPALGRWIQRDPLGYVDGMDKYAYGRSRPIGTLDPSGLQSAMEAHQTEWWPGGTLKQKAWIYDKDTGEPVLVDTNVHVPPGYYRSYQLKEGLIHGERPHGTGRYPSKIVTLLRRKLGSGPITTLKAEYTQEGFIVFAKPVWDGDGEPEARQKCWRIGYFPGRLSTQVDTTLFGEYWEAQKARLIATPTAFGIMMDEVSKGLFAADLTTGVLGDPIIDVLEIPYQLASNLPLQKYKAEVRWLDETMLVYSHLYSRQNVVVHLAWDRDREHFAIDNIDGGVLELRIEYKGPNNQSALSVYEAVDKANKINQELVDRYSEVYRNVYTIDSATAESSLPVVHVNKDGVIDRTYPHITGEYSAPMPYFEEEPFDYSR